MSKMRALTTVFLTALSLAGTAGCATEDEEATSGDQGELKNNTLSGEYPATGTDGACTFTRVAPKLFLTAAHCLVAKNLVGSRRYITNLPSGFSSDLQKSALQVTVSAVLIDPSYQAAFDGGWVKNSYEPTHVPDIGVFEVEENIPTKIWPIAPVDYNPVRDSGLVEYPLYTFGYGAPGRQGTSERRGGTLTLADTAALCFESQESTELCNNRAKNLFASIAAIGTETVGTQLTPGDSGGPIVRGNAVVGVNLGSYATRFSTYNLHTRVSASSKIREAISRGLI